MGLEVFEHGGKMFLSEGITSRTKVLHVIIWRSTSVRRVLVAIIA
jgi:hypothetical protein